MDAGKLDRRVTLQRKGADTDDGYQTVPGDWADLADVWAQFLPLTASERAQAGEMAAFQKARYKFRKDSSWADLDAKDGLVDGSQSFNIVSVTMPERGWMIAECVARADGGE
jgi:head-tail adaptor